MFSNDYCDKFLSNCQLDEGFVACRGINAELRGIEAESRATEAKRKEQLW